MLGNIIGFFSLAISLWAFAYMLGFQNPYHPVYAAIAAAVGLLAAVVALLIPTWSRLRTLQSVATNRMTGLNWRGPINLPTLLWTVNCVFVVMFLVQIRLADMSKDINSNLANTVGKISGLTDQMVSASRQAASFWDQEEHGLPANISAGNQAALSWSLEKAKTHYKVQVYRELNDQCVALGNEFDDVFRSGKWDVLEASQSPPKGIRKMKEGIHIRAPMIEPPYLGAALLQIKLREIGIKAEVDEDESLLQCQCMVVTIAEVAPNPMSTPVTKASK
jgi:hypothetical protein